MRSQYRALHYSALRGKNLTTASSSGEFSFPIVLNVLIVPVIIEPVLKTVSAVFASQFTMYTTAVVKAKCELRIVVFGIIEL